MAGRIFLNYRRGDDPGSTGRLYDRLEAEFGAGQLFMDVEGHIRGGDDFVEVLKAQVSECDVLLAVVGPRWLEEKDEQGRRRLDNPEDWVRVEILGALESAKRVIPVLVGGAGIPRAEDLPEPLKPLARRQAIRVTLERFKADSQGLVSQIKAALAEVEQARAAATETERQAVAEAERRRRDEEEARNAERQRQEAESARQQALAGMTGEQITRALELENWNFVKDKNDPAELRDHIARFAGGPTERYAAERLASLVWAGLGIAADKAALQAFLDEFPKAREAGQAQAALTKVEAAEAAERSAAEQRAQETEAWAAVASSTDKSVIEAFLRAWPKWAHAADAKARLRELRGSGRFSRRTLLKGAAYGVGGTAIVAGGAFATLVPGMPIWRLANDRSIRTFTGHGSIVASVAFAPDGRTALSGSYDDTLKLWDVATGKTLRTFMGHTGRVASVAFAPDGRTALSDSIDRIFKLWDVATGRELRTFTGHTRLVGSVAFAPDGRTALSGSSDQTIKLWDVATGQELRTFTGHTGSVICVVFAPDGRTVLSGSSDGALKLWEVSPGTELRTFEGHSAYVNSVVFAPDGGTALSGSADYTLKLWNVATGRVLRIFRHMASVNSVAFAPDGRTALSAGADWNIKLWEIATGRELRTFTGHSHKVTSVAFAPDGRTALSGSNDHTLKLWGLSR